MILLINGPSGSGKSTLGDYYKSLGIKKIITTTTREKRVNEVHGVDYYFVTIDEFKNIDFIESSNYNGNYYGVSKDSVDGLIKKGITSFAVLDINGIRKFKKLYGDEAKFIYIRVSKSSLEKRMLKRGDSYKNVISRLKFYSKSGEVNNYMEADFIINNNHGKSSFLKEGRKIIKKLGVKL